MYDIYELSPSMRVLLCMHNLCAVDQKSAKKAEDLTTLCNLESNDMEKALSELVSFGYIIKKDYIYYLSSLGITVVRSVYT